MRRALWLIVAAFLVTPLACEESAAAELQYTAQEDHALVDGILGEWRAARGTAEYRLVVCEDTTPEASYCRARELCHEYRADGQGRTESMVSTAGGCDGPGASAGAAVEATLEAGANRVALRGELARAWSRADLGGPTEARSGSRARSAYEGSFVVSLRSPEPPDAGRVATSRVQLSVQYSDGALTGTPLVTGPRVGGARDAGGADGAAADAGESDIDARERSDGGPGDSGVDGGRDGGAPGSSSLIWRKTATRAVACAR